MNYQSTRDSKISITAARAIAQGLSADGGLFLPETLPRLTPEMISKMTRMGYSERASLVLSMFLEDFGAEELSTYTGKAYGSPGFSSSSAAPLHKLDSNTHFLELWHGPTSAFKDIALQILPYLLSASLKKTNDKREACILVATSGDTGKAALEGFRDVAGTRIMVFYPLRGVSEIQRLQMATQSGANVNVVAVEGNFDDAQKGVKEIFSDETLREELNGKGFFLSSANSINWGRLVPQIVYYVSSYCDLIASGEISTGDRVNYCVPTGNFGNILAAWYAKEIGLPVSKLICASNINNVLTQFINTGAYSRERPFYTTMSPSMDILVSSNLERLLFEASGKDSAVTAGYMSALSNTGRYEVTGKMRDVIGETFTGLYASEDDTKKAIAEVFNRYSYLVDTHTAVAYKALRDYRETTLDDTPSIVVSTASPFKFCESVLDALGIGYSGSGVDLIDRLSEETGCPVPEPLAALRGMEPRFKEAVRVNGMNDAVRRFVES